MKIAIHQPHYLPWLGYFAKWAAADLFVFLDTVQYEKNGWQNRNRIKTRDGPRWLTAPVRARLGTAIRDVMIDTTQPWRARHFRAIDNAYAKATARLVALCQAVGADTYLAGRDGALYLDADQFAAAGIAVETQRYEHPVYAQEHGEYAPLSSALDLLLMPGDEALGILCGGSTWLPLSPVLR